MLDNLCAFLCIPSNLSIASKHWARRDQGRVQEIKEKKTIPFPVYVVQVYICLYKSHINL